MHTSWATWLITQKHCCNTYNAIKYCKCSDIFFSTFCQLANGPALKSLLRLLWVIVNYGIFSPVWSFYIFKFRCIYSEDHSIYVHLLWRVYTERRFVLKTLNYDAYLNICCTSTVPSHFKILLLSSSGIIIAHAPLLCAS